MAFDVEEGKAYGVTCEGWTSIKSDTGIVGVLLSLMRRLVAL